MFEPFRSSYTPGKPNARPERLNLDRHWLSYHPLGHPHAQTSSISSNTCKVDPPPLCGRKIMYGQEWGCAQVSATFASKDVWLLPEFGNANQETKQ